MAHTYGCCLYHVVFSTSGRRNLIAQDWLRDVWDYIGGIARNNDFKTLMVGGTVNHVHALIQLPPAIAPSKAVQLIKGGAAKWLNDAHDAEARSFGWQEGYGVFTIGYSQVPATIRYIETQLEHHRTRSFEDEYRAFLRKHMIEVNEEYIFDKVQPSLRDSVH